MTTACAIGAGLCLVVAIASWAAAGLYRYRMQNAVDERRAASGEPPSPASLFLGQFTLDSDYAKFCPNGQDRRKRTMATGVGAVALIGVAVFVYFYRTWAI